MARNNSTQRHGRPGATAGPSKLLKPAYDKSWAVVIGINQYQHLPPSTTPSPTPSAWPSC
jgi:hypothetical protein